MRRRTAKAGTAPPLRRRLAAALFVSAAAAAAPARAENGADPFDPFDRSPRAESVPGTDTRTVIELLSEGNELLQEERLLDARSKFLEALRKDPSFYPTHMMLGGYYLGHVGHFRLAMKYLKQAEKLFTDRAGPPPYSSAQAASEHSRLLYLLSQTRLNLDDYEGALATLDRFTSLGYTADWYPGSRAWILMKLGRIKEAIGVARLGVLGGAEAGRNLNILGILLSMNGEPRQAVSVFRTAIDYELSLGTAGGGQPATPMNNTGEVYEEMFEDEKAEAAWLRARSMPDGCEHVLPSLNLAVLYIDQTDYAAASDAMDSFERCVAQYPLRSADEYRALVHLVRARVSLLTGRPAEGLGHVDAALEKVQWFGKIGTSQDDLRAGGLVTRAEIFDALAGHAALRVSSGLVPRLVALKDRAVNRAKAWWSRRQAVAVLTEELNDLEDLKIRNTDSLVQYSSFGTTLARLPYGLLEAKIAALKAADTRPGAVPYYDAYLAENRGTGAEAERLASEALGRLRPRYDDGLSVQLGILRMRASPAGPTYARDARDVFRKAPAALRNAGLKLPVTIECAGSPDLADAVSRGPFAPVPASSADAHVVRCERAEGKHRLVFAGDGVRKGVAFTGDDPAATVEGFAGVVFGEDVGRGNAAPAGPGGRTE